MDITPFALGIVLVATFLYALYLVVRAAVRDGIRQAAELAQEPGPTLDHR